MAPKACAPNSAISSRVISWLSLPSSVGCAMQAAVQPTPTAASVLTIRHRPPSAGTRLCTRGLRLLLFLRPEAFQLLQQRCHKIAERRRQHKAQC